MSRTHQQRKGGMGSLFHSQSLGSRYRIRLLEKMDWRNMGARVHMQVDGTGRLFVSWMEPSMSQIRAAEAVRRTLDIACRISGTRLDDGPGADSAYAERMYGRPLDPKWPYGFLSMQADAMYRVNRRQDGATEKAQEKAHIDIMVMADLPETEDSGSVYEPGDPANWAGLGIREFWRLRQGPDAEPVLEIWDLETVRPAVFSPSMPDLSVDLAQICISNRIHLSAQAGSEPDGAACGRLLHEGDMWMKKTLEDGFRRSRRPACPPAHETDGFRDGPD